MELKLNSWYVWLWNYTYETNVPNNLCPLFWKLIVAILLFIPNLILRIPIVIINLFSKSKMEQGDARTGIGAVIYIGFFVTGFVIDCLYNYSLWLFNAYSYNNAAATIGGCILTVTGFFIIRYYWLEQDIGEEISEKVSNNIIVNYSKSWYNNHCPKINWK